MQILMMEVHRPYCEETARAHFFSSHLEGMKRRLGSGPWCSEWISGSRVNQSTSGSYGFTCTRSNDGSAPSHSTLAPGMNHTEPRLSMHRTSAMHRLGCLERRR